MLVSCCQIAVFRIESDAHACHYVLATCLIAYAGDAQKPCDEVQHLQTHLFVHKQFDPSSIISLVGLTSLW
jgi:hypothetical protein